VLAVSLDQVYLDEMTRDFGATISEEIVSVRLDRKRKRSATLFIGETFTPAPRDTGQRRADPHTALSARSRPQPIR
jgi:hypothetical protein